MDKTITLEDFFSNSFVLTIDEKRFKNFINIFKRVFQTKTLPKKFNGFQDKNLTGPENCTKGHFSIINYAKQKKMPYVAIFEDDAYPCINCKCELENVLLNIPSDSSFILLGWSDFSKFKKQNFYSKFNKINTIFSGSHSYVIFENEYDNYLNYIKCNPSTTADGTIFNKINNSYTLDKPIFIQYTNLHSMNKHIGYILYGNHINPPKGYGYIEDILK